MVGSLSEVPIRLYRPSTTTPWGFRLQGGAGTNLPLSIQRVFAGGTADGHLNRGDELVAIDNHDVTGAPHYVAEDLIKQAGRELLLIVKRQSAAFSPHASENQFTHYPFELQTGGLEEYEHAKNINQIKEKFSTPDEDVVRGKIQINAKPGSTSYIPKKPRMFQKISQNQNAPEFGWVPKPKSHEDIKPPSRYQSQSQPVVRQVLSNEEAVSSYNKPLQQVPHEQYERPAWLGTLRSAAGPKPWEVQDGAALLGINPEPMPSQPSHFEAPVASGPFQPQIARPTAISAIHQPKVQVTKFSPQGHPTYERKNASNHDSDTARIAHLQYNSPIGLYSQENAKEVLDVQTGGKPGSGTLRIIGKGPNLSSFDPIHSDVYRLVREEETARRSRQKTQQAPQHNHPHVQHGLPHEDHRSAKLEQLIHENDDQKLMYEEHVYSASLRRILLYIFIDTVLEKAGQETQSNLNFELGLQHKEATFQSE
ncbi:hypothetical protein HELRODRAFT_192354 [Helobdella robusta]|uniref:PDZ domain-containing protein n=1 Tax=Helobdella robusta TaxID=6412 RepID=T1FTU8_HELRO|nr:hypothetical protein HELRODRAFT_192354 [Helobdella robusta]ESO01031.1 hypothetical protein HELRODRAFT_192354 [Helobdella robusta]